jgi:hypothetical protein
LTSDLHRDKGIQATVTTRHRNRDPHLSAIATKSKSVTQSDDSTAPSYDVIRVDITRESVVNNDPNEPFVTPTLFLIERVETIRVTSSEQANIKPCPDSTVVELNDRGDNLTDLLTHTLSYTGNLFGWLRPTINQ